MYEHPGNILRAKELRKNASVTEKIFWGFVRNNKLGGFQFRRQYPIGKYFVDFVCLEKRLVVELDGDQHFNEAGIVYDNKRTDFIKSQGFDVVRIPNIDLLKEKKAVVYSLWRVLNEEVEARDFFVEKYKNPPPKNL
jgi:very-short-patch-repair endonuclease